MSDQDNRCYVGNLPFSTTSEDLSDLFAQAGTVKDATVIIDRDSGRSRGFGFVEMSSSEEANTAVSKFNEYALDGRNLKVNIARPRENRGGGNRGGGNRGGGGYGGGGRY